MVEPQDITYLSEGAPVPARLYAPPEADAPPAGLLLCAGRFRDIEGLEFLSTALADAGYAVLATRYRGMDFFTDDADVRAGLDWMTEQVQIDASRLAIVGHSRGGMAGLRAAALDQRVRAVAALAPPIDFVSYIQAMALLSPMRYKGLTASMGGTPEEVPERYHLLSALSYADRIQVPVLLACGNQDLHAPLDHSQQMHAALTAAGNADCHLEVLDGVGHFFERMYFGYQFQPVADLVTGWLKQRLPA